MNPLQVTALSALVAAVVAAVVLLAIRRLRPGGDAPAGPALAAGFLAAFPVVAGVPSLPILDAWKWLFFIGLAGGVVAVLASRAKDPPEFVRWILRAALAAFAVGVSVLHPTVPWLAGSFAAVLALTWCFDGVARRTSAAAFLATVLLVANGAAVAIGYSNFGTLAQVAGVLTAATGACLVLAWKLPLATRNAAALVAVLLATMFLNGVVYADLPVVSTVLLAAAAPAAWTVACLSSSMTANRRAALVVAAAALFCAVGAGIAVAESEPMGY